MTFSGEGYRWYGFDIMFSMIMEGKRLSDVTTLFPRVTWCRVQERGKESILTHNMNCVLPVNLFNEMVFLVSQINHSYRFSFNHVFLSVNSFKVFIYGRINSKKLSISWFDFRHFFYHSAA